MKQNNNKQLTKEDLKNAFNAAKEDLNFAFGKKIDKKLKNYPTKSDLDERFSKFANAIRNETDHKFEMMMEDFKAQMSKFTNMILTAIDPLIKDMEARQQENAVAAGQYYRTTKKLENHEKRIAKLEQS